MDIFWGVLNGLHFNATAFWVQIVLFVVFHVCMKVIIYDPLLATRAARDGQIDGRLQQAKKLAVKAQQLKTDYEASLRRVREELHGKLQQSIVEAEAEGARQHSTARGEADKILDESQIKLDAELHTMQGQMDQQVDKLARSVARRVVEENFSATTQTKLLAKIGG